MNSKPTPAKIGGRRFENFPVWNSEKLPLALSYSIIRRFLFFSQNIHKISIQAYQTKIYYKIHVQEH